MPQQRATTGSERKTKMSESQWEAMMLELASRTTQLEQTADKTDDEDAELDDLANQALEG